MHNFAIWWSSLSWSAAAGLVLLACSLGICSWIVGVNWLRATLGGNRRGIPPRRHDDLPFTDHTRERKSFQSSPWPITDYSAQYDEKSKQLGDDGLIAKPQPRIRPGSHEVGKVVRLQGRKS